MFPNKGRGCQASNWTHRHLRSNRSICACFRHTGPESLSNMRKDAGARNRPINRHGNSVFFLIKPLTTIDASLHERTVTIVGPIGPMRALFVRHGTF